MTGDYKIHQVWETTQLSKMERALVKDLSSGGVVYRCAVGQPEDGFYPFLSTMRSPTPTPGHSAKFTVRILGRKPREFRQTYVFSKETELFYIPDFLPASIANQFLRKDRLSIEITIEHSEELPDYRKVTGYVGLQNKAATCYMNSILEMLFHIPAFRRLIYSMDAQESKVILALQQLFCLLQLSPVAATTDDLIKSFGWTGADAFYQHDVQEFVRILLSKLEDKMKKTPLDGQIAELFSGKISRYVKCVNVDYESTHDEEFYDVSLVVKGKKNIEESLESFIEEEFLTGDNKYKVEGQGPQDAVMGCKFSKLPPVLHFHLVRFAYSETSIVGMEKVRDRFEFSEVLDMSRYCEDKSQDAVYELFSVLVHLGNNMGGHYIAYCRPTEDRKWFRFNDSQVEEVNISEVTEKNFGGPNQMNEAYYLCYVKRGEIPWIMEQIPTPEIPSHLLDYFETKRDALDPKMMTVTITNAPGSPSLRFDKNHNIESLVREIQKTVPECKSLWTVSADGLPWLHLQPRRKLRDVMKVGRIFAAPFSVDDRIPNPCAFLLQFFFKGRPLPLQTLGYRVVSQDSKANAIFPVVCELAGFPKGTLYECFRESCGTVQKLRTDEDLAVECRMKCSGKLIFQLAKEFEGTETKFSFPEEKENTENLVRVRDLIPGIPLDTAERFLNHIKRCIHVVVHDTDNKLMTVVEIPDMMKLRILIRCIRTALKLEENEGVALYLPNPKDRTTPAETLLNSLENVDLAKALNLRGRPQRVAIFAKIVKGMTQTQTDNMITLRMSLLNDVSNVIGSVVLELPNDSTAKQALEEARKHHTIPDDMPLRIVAVFKASIVQTLKETDKIVDFRQFELRIEYVPEPQRDLSSGILLKCAFSTNYNYPPYDCIFTPFYLKVDEGEPFELTKCKISSLIENSIEDLDYILYRGRVFTQRFVVLTDEMVLNDMATESDAELFLMLKPEVMMKMYRSSMNKDLKIYD